jgi:hypothetical protein
LPWLNSYKCHTQLYARLWKYLISYSKLVDLCVGICLCGIGSWKPHVWWFSEMKKLLNLQQRCSVERPGSIAWPWMSFDFTPVGIFWSNVTEHIYSPPFGILLMEGHTEIEQVLRPAIFWDCTKHKVVILFQRFGITNRSHLQGSSCPSTTCLDSTQPALTGCLLEQLTVIELI